MSKIFISHSSVDNAAALAIAKWLEDSGWGEYFLDITPSRGLAPGERWQAALKAAADRCEAVLFLISPAWLTSRWCLAEFLLAKQLGKTIFGVLVEEVPLESLPREMTAEWQLCDLVKGSARRSFQASGGAHRHRYRGFIRRRRTYAPALRTTTCGARSREFSLAAAGRSKPAAISRLEGARGRGRRGLLWPRGGDRARSRQLARLARSRSRATFRHSRRVGCRQVLVSARRSVAALAPRRSEFSAFARRPPGTRGDQWRHRSGGEFRGGVPPARSCALASRDQRALEATRRTGVVARRPAGARLVAARAGCCTAGPGYRDRSG